MQSKNFHDIKIFLSDVSDGNMAFHIGDEKEKALQNREHLFENVQIDLRKAIFAQQTHSDHIQIVTQKDAGRGTKDHKNAFEDTDAFITSDTGIVLCVQVADCVSVALWDSKKKIIASVHAGWRGMEKKIIKKTVERMIRLGSFGEDIYVWVGPSAGPCCFEVGPEVREKFVHVRGKCVDLWSEAVDQLGEFGIDEKNIQVERKCTICNDRYFSYRRDGENAGRMIMGIARGSKNMVG